ncbi:Uncharacterised protein [Mycobacteroides abscessus subsp. massiliense]|nr:Uncharacterised protein [Mycobacteroides abscessus subsp. massiliense]
MQVAEFLALRVQLARCSQLDAPIGEMLQCGGQQLLFSTEISVYQTVIDGRMRRHIAQRGRTRPLRGEEFCS